MVVGTLSHTLRELRSPVNPFMALVQQPVSEEFEVKAT